MSDQPENVGEIGGYQYGKQSLSTTDSTISSTTVPTATTTENATSRQFTISGGPNETVSNQ
ncbi:hypothetical protein CR513_59631, partial [Mucuna pruriens]